MGGCHSVVQTAPWRDHQDPYVLQASDMADLSSRPLKGDEKSPPATKRALHGYGHLPAYRAKILTVLGRLGLHSASCHAAQFIQRGMEIYDIRVVRS